MLNPLVHVLAVINFVVAIHSQLTTPPLDPEDAVKHQHLGTDKFGGPWKYLTFWNLWIQLVFFLVCVANDIKGRKNNDLSRMKKWEDFLYASFAFPIGMLVAIIFWVLYSIDRNLVFPEVLDKYISSFTNHMLHTFIVPFLLVELFTVHHKYPSSWIGALTTVSFCFVYLCWTLVVAHFGGFWVYPILAQLELIPRMAFLLACSAFGAVLYWLGLQLNLMIWKNVGRKVKSKRS